VHEILAISGGLSQVPLNPLKTWGRQVFQVGQAPSGPTVIRPLNSLDIYAALKQQNQSGYSISRSCIFTITSRNSFLLSKDNTIYILSNVWIALCNPMDPLRLSVCDIMVFKFRKWSSWFYETLWRSKIVHANIAVSYLLKLFQCSLFLKKTAMAAYSLFDLADRTLSGPGTISTTSWAILVPRSECFWHLSKRCEQQCKRFHQMAKRSTTKKPMFHFKMQHQNHLR